MSTKQSKKLSTEQQKIVEDISENPKCNFCILGSAGTGKSVLIRYLNKHLSREKKRDDGATNVRICTPTGLSASNVQGTTIHSLFKIFPTNVINYFNDESSVSGIIKRLNRKYPEVIEKLRNLEVLIIDEISMVEGTLFNLLNEMLQFSRNCFDYFGGVQLIIFGDFMQLSPISPDKKSEAIYAFETDVWKSAITKYYVLTHIFRQEGDDGYKDILESLRWGYLSPEHKDVLLSKNMDSNTYYNISKCNPSNNSDILTNKIKDKIDEKDIFNNTSSTDNDVDVKSDNNDDDDNNDNDNNDDLYLKLHCLRKQAETDNDIALNALQGEEKKYNIIVEGDQGYFSDLIKDQSSLIPTVCRFKIGAHVLLTKNIEFPTLVNGSLGVITGFEEIEREIKKYVPKTRTFIACKLSELAPKIKFRERPDEVVITREEWKRNEVIINPNTKKPEQKEIIMYQYPLISGYSCTGHKSQGMTLSRVIVRLENAFADGQIYVMLSRVKSLEGLSLFGFDPSKIMANVKAILFMKDIYDSCHKVCRILDHVVKNIRRSKSNLSILGKRNKKDREKQGIGIKLDTLFIPYVESADNSYDSEEDYNNSI